MPVRKEKLLNNEIYHIVVRGVSDSLIFKDISDYYRGIFSIYEFNDLRPVEIRERREERARLKKLEKVNGSPSSVANSVANDNRDPLVEILAFCFMPNHIHLLLKQIKDNGITKFMRKVETGYAKYFRKRYEEMGKGYVFQGRFQSAHIEKDEYLMTVFAYIHANPASLIEPKWKEFGINNSDKVINFLKDYKWSSYADYIGGKNFPSVTKRNFITELIGSEENCKDFIENYIRYKEKNKSFSELYLE